MTKWALIVLVSSFALGLSRFEAGKAVRVAIWITVLIVFAVSARNGAL